MTTIQDKLIAWGRGKAISDPPNGYPEQTPFARLIRNPGQANVGILPLDSEDQARIDAAVSAMKLTKPDHYEIICYAYIAQMRDDAIRHKVRRSKSWVRDIRRNAEHYLEGRLE